MLIIKIKIMPISPSTNLDSLQEEITKIIEELQGKVHAVEKQPVAFTLNALILTLTWPDDVGTDELEKKLLKIKQVSSAQIIDVRRSL